MPGPWQILILALWAGLAVQTVLLFALLRYAGLLLRTAPGSGLPPGQRAPALTLRPTCGPRLTLGAPSGRPRLLLFIAPDCPVCAEITDEFQDLALAHGDRLEGIVISVEGFARDEFARDEPTAAERGLNATEAEPLTVVQVSSLPSAYQVPGTPYAALLDTGGVVRRTGVVRRRADLDILITGMVPGGPPAAQAQMAGSPP